MEEAEVAVRRSLQAAFGRQRGGIIRAKVLQVVSNRTGVMEAKVHLQERK